MSGVGYKQTSSRRKSTSGLPPKADMAAGIDRGSPELPWEALESRCGATITRLRGEAAPQLSSPTHWKTLSAKGSKFSAHTRQNISGGTKWEIVLFTRRLAFLAVGRPTA